MHRFIPADSSTSPATLDPAHTAAIKRWTAEILRLPPDALVTVSETACVDAGCPLVESVVSLFEENRIRAWKFTRPKVAVTKMMLQQTLATAPRVTQKSKPSANRSKE